MSVNLRPGATVAIHAPLDEGGMLGMVVRPRRRMGQGGADVVRGPDGGRSSGTGTHFIEACHLHPVDDATYRAWAARRAGLSRAAPTAVPARRHRRAVDELLGGLGPPPREPGTAVGTVSEPLVDDAIVQLRRLADGATRTFHRSRAGRHMYGSPRTSWVSDSHLDSTSPYSWAQIERIAQGEGWGIEIVWMPGWPIPDAAPARRRLASVPLVDDEVGLFDLPPAA